MFELKETRTAKLSQLSRLASGGTPSRSNESYWNGDIPWVTTSEVAKYRFINVTKEYITSEGLKQSSAKLFPSGTILLAMYGQGKTRGKVALLDIEATTNQACLAIISNQTMLDNYFLYYYLERLYERMRLMANSGGQENLSMTLVKELVITYPSMNIQSKIGVFFNLIDSKIEKQKEKVELLKVQKKGLMHKIFSQEFRFKDEVGEEFPEWENKSLKHFATKILKKNTDSKISSVISNSAKHGLVSQRSYFKKDIANELNINGYYVISNEDFVYNPRISSESPFGPIHMYTAHDDGIVSPLYLCFKTQNIKSNFLKYFFISSLWHKHIYTHGDSGARHDRVSIKDSNFFEMIIPIPSLNEQEKINRFLYDIDRKIILEKERLDYLFEMKNGFMQQMFI